MSDDDKFTHEFTLKVSLSPNEKPSNQEKSEKASISSKLKDEARLLERTSVIIDSAGRNTEYGQTQIQILKFKEDNQREKVLKLLDDSLHSRLSILYKYLRLLGFSSGSAEANERRYYAARAVGALMCQPNYFADLKENVLLPWAKTLNGQQAAALALAYVIIDEHYSQEAFNLLKHWISNNNTLLGITALLTYNSVAQFYPDQTLDIVKSILVKNRFDIFLLTIHVVNNIYHLHPERVIEHLHEWIVDSNPKQKELESLRRYMASQLFLVIVQLEDIPEDDIPQTKLKVVDIIFTLWTDARLPMRSKIQEDTAKLVKRWAEEAINARSNKPVLFELCHNLFDTLSKRYEKEKKTPNHMEFYLKKWLKYNQEFAAFMPQR